MYRDAFSGDERIWLTPENADKDLVSLVEGLEIRRGSDLRRRLIADVEPYTYQNLQQYMEDLRKAIQVAEVVRKEQRWFEQRAVDEFLKATEHLVKGLREEEQ